jgi:uncharacterized protein YbjT (DUF2867 family)
VAGGTGLAGRRVVELLRAAGHEPVVLARSRGVDVTTGAGLDDALRGVHAVVDVTNAPTTRRGPALAFFTAATASLLDAGARAGVRHHVALSIVGCDRVPLGLYSAKARQEELVLAGAVPGTVLRATQFHEFASTLLDGLPGPVAVVPRMRCRPVAVREVAAELVRLALGEPRGRAPELAGPREEQMTDMARRLARARGRRRPVVGVRLPGAVGRGFAGGALLPTDPGPRGAQTFDAWLAAVPSRTAGSSGDDGSSGPSGPSGSAGSSGTPGPSERPEPARAR